MKRFHVNPETGRAGACSAKIKCRFGAVNHYSSKEEAQAAFESDMKLFELPYSNDETLYAAEVIRTLGSLQKTDHGYFFDRGTPETCNSTDVGRFLIRKAKELVQAHSTDKIYEEDITVANRRILKEMKSKDIESQDFWKEYARRLNNYKPQDSNNKLPVNWEGHGEVKIGDYETASSLMKAFDSLPAPLKVSQEDPESAPKVSGFKYLGCGYEQLAYLHEDSSVVYKVALWYGNESSISFVMNSLASQEAFPKVAGLSWARVSGYANGQRGVIAQEIASGKEIEADFTKKQWLWLNFSGHEDLTPGNYLISSDGTVNCYDSGGVIYDDADENYRPQRLIAR